MINVTFVLVVALFDGMDGVVGVELVFGRGYEAEAIEEPAGDVEELVLVGAVHEDVVVLGACDKKLTTLIVLIFLRTTNISKIH